MPKFRKKPVVIEAVQWDQFRETNDIVDAWAGKPLACRCDYREGSPFLLIPTLEGEMEAAGGDWIIRGIKGEIYPCKPDIFAATYDPVDAA